MSKQPPWDEWIEGYTKYLIAADRPASTLRLRGDQLRHLGDSIGIDPDQVALADLIGWFAGQDWATETRRSYRSAVRGLYAWALAAGLIDHDPAASLPVVSQHPGLPRPAPDDAYTAACERATPHARLMLRLAAETGLRRAEIARVHRDDLRAEPDGYSLLVHGKGRKQRMIPIPDDLGETIKGADGWLFPSARSGGHVTPEWVGELCADLLPDKWTLHTLRHRFATRAFAGSRNIRAVQELLGHSSVATTQRYVAVDSSALRSTMMAAAGPMRKLAAAMGIVTMLLFMCAADDDCEHAVVVSPGWVTVAHWCRG